MNYTSLVLALLCLSITAFAQTADLSGTIQNVRGERLAGVRVTIYPSMATAYTDITGSFSFTDQPGVTTSCSAELKGYRSKNLEFATPATNRHLDITLTKLYQELEEVVVVDDHLGERKRTESLNLEIVSPAFIQRNLGGSLMKTLERLPGIKTIGIGSGQSKPLIRGLGFNRVVVVDKGLKHEGQQWGADHGLEIDQFATGEVELVKGAASFAFGSDAIAGVINVKPARIPAPRSFGGAVDLVGKTNNGLYGTSVNVYGRSKTWFADARFTHQQYGDYRVPTDTVFVYDYAVRLRENRLRTRRAGSRH